MQSIGQGDAVTKVIDADSHLFEQPGLWRDHLPSNQRDLALELEEDELGYTWLTHKERRLLQCYISEPGKLWESYGLPHQRQSEGQPALRRYTEMPARYHDPAARRDALDGWGIDEQVIFPNWGLNFGWYLQNDVESELANITAWNRWACEVRAEGGGRLRPAGHCTLRGGLDWIRDELDGLARGGVTQVFLPAGLANGRRMSHPDFDPVWTQMVSLGLVPTLHIGAFAERIIDDGWQSNDVIQYMTTQSLVMIGLDAQIAIADLILNGVFDRHPELTLVVCEYSVGWLPELQFRLDIGFDIHHKVTAKHNVELALRPSEYVSRNLRCVSFPSEQPQRIMDTTGDILMFGSDYPHAEGLADPLADYETQVGDMGARHESFYGGTLAAVLV
jgi:predicted TIM-barrel fold metal-dependent hydrolase